MTNQFELSNMNKSNVKITFDSEKIYLIYQNKLLKNPLLGGGEIGSSSSGGANVTGSSSFKFDNS